MTVLSLSTKHASNWQNFLLVRKCPTLSEAQTWSLAGRLKRQRQVVLQKAVDYQYPGFIETTGDPVKQTDDNVTIPVLSKYKFCLKFMKLSRLTDSPLPPPFPQWTMWPSLKSHPPLSPLPQEINNNWVGGGGGRCAFYPHLIFQYQRVTFLNYPIFPETDVSDSRLELSLWTTLRSWRWKQSFREASSYDRKTAFWTDSSEEAH